MTPIGLLIDASRCSVCPERRGPFWAVLQRDDVIAACNRCVYPGERRVTERRRRR
jgi:hypothetical protein